MFKINNRHDTTRKDFQRRNARIMKALNKLRFTMRSVADKISLKTVKIYLIYLLFGKQCRGVLVTFRRNTADTHTLRPKEIVFMSARIT